MKHLLTLLCAFSSLSAMSQAFICHSGDNKVEFEYRNTGRRDYEITNKRSLENQYFSLSSQTRFKARLKSTRPGGDGEKYLMGDIKRYAKKSDLSRLNFRLEGFQESSNSYRANLVIRAYRSQFGAVDAFSERLNCRKK